jgi:multimeric flavodoxin WrbA
MEIPALSAIFLNCTLKRSPEVSNTQALIDKVAGLMQRQGVETASIRIADLDVLTGVSSDLGEGDDWPGVLASLKAADIVVIATPIWMGYPSSLCQRVIERLDATFSEYDPRDGQFPLYNKVGGVIVTGNEDGAQACSAHVLYALQSFGCVIPPNSDVYWVGDAGAGPSYLDAGGPRHFYTNKVAAWMAHNAVWMARVMEEHPFPTNLLELAEEQLAISDPPKTDPHEERRQRIVDIGNASEEAP